MNETEQALRGQIRNRDMQYRSGILFNMTIDNIFIPETPVTLEIFFEGIESIQGQRNFR